MKKIVINYAFGGFNLSTQALNTLGVDKHHQYSVARDDARLVAMVEADAKATAGNCCKLAAIEIPENASDWMINEYDGAEEIIFVVDGKLHRKGQKGGCPSIFI